MQHAQAQAQLLSQPEAGASPPSKRPRVQAVWPAPQDVARPAATGLAGSGPRLAPGTPPSDAQPVEIVRHCADVANVRPIQCFPAQTSARASQTRR